MDLARQTAAFQRSFTTSNSPSDAKKTADQQAAQKLAPTGKSTAEMAALDRKASSSLSSLFGAWKK
jgi:hypothetical protein